MFAKGTVDLQKNECDRSVLKVGQEARVFSTGMMVCLAWGQIIFPRFEQALSLPAKESVEKSVGVDF